MKRYLWDGNVLLHEWEYNVADEPQLVTSEIGEVSFNKPEPINNLITWVYEDNAFVPCAKLTENGSYDIISDYIGRPIQAYDNNGNLVWSCDYDIYGNLKNLKGDRSFIPFRQLGQYEDVETGLYYNRFRYYSPESGLYISQDPIGLLGNNPNFYAYVFDSNSQVDVFGLDIDYKAVFFEAYPELKGKVWVHHSIERQVLKRYVGLFTEAEINELKMLRGIPKEVNADIHLSKIRMEWNDFYKKIDLGKVELTKENFLNKAKNIDDMFGEFFTPKIIKKSKICS
ncbi:hypothetical protein CKY20_11210 [Capnocytophaga canis]|uniref:Teneurin-like YD-shell domain-containing protein n=1 Tax=Capnocytophaga canis TaxID=1848903 RepID=A0A3A1YD53_9FLAO|nr:hypothetical protein CKY20_11210 [Capnocytophaga canis]